MIYMSCYWRLHSLEFGVMFLFSSNYVIFNYFDYAPVLVKTFAQVSLCVCVRVYVYSIAVLIHYMHYKTQKVKNGWMYCISVCTTYGPVGAPLVCTKFHPETYSGRRSSTSLSFLHHHFSPLSWIISICCCFSHLKKGLLWPHLF